MSIPTYIFSLKLDFEWGILAGGFLTELESIFYVIKRDFLFYFESVYLPYARHYKPRLVLYFTQFSLWLRPILQTIYVLKMEILHFLSSKSAAYKQERLQIESGL